MCNCARYTCIIDALAGDKNKSDARFNNNQHRLDARSRSLPLSHTLPLGYEECKTFVIEKIRAIATVASIVFSAAKLFPSALVFAALCT